MKDSLIKDRFDKLISIRINSEQLKRLNRILGTKDSKTIRACMDYTELCMNFQRFLKK